MDRIDHNILKTLQAKGRISVTELSELVGLSKTPCTERMRRLEKDGLIKGYHAELDVVRLGYPHVAFVQVKLERTTTDVLDGFNAAARRLPEVESCHMIAGDFDYLLKVRTRDMAHYRKVLGDHIGALPGVASTHSYAVMETVVEKKGLDPVLIGERAKSA